MKRWEELQAPYGIYQDPDYGCISADPIRLVHFMKLKPTDRCLDLGTGNGIIPLYASILQGGRWTGIDISREQLSLARSSAERNGLDTLHFLQLDVKDAPGTLGRECFETVCTNPPYFPPQKAAEDKERDRARHGELGSFLEAAFACLKNGGRFYICYKAELLSPLIEQLRTHRLELKRMELLLSKGKGELVLLECKKHGGPGITVTIGER